MSNKKITMICKYCGSKDVRKDAYVTWSEEDQDWEIENVFDKADHCADCDGETRIIGNVMRMKPIIVKEENVLVILDNDDNIVRGIVKGRGDKDLKPFIKKAISEEFCGVEVLIEHVEFNKQNYSYSMEVEILDGEDSNIYEFILQESCMY